MEPAIATTTGGKRIVLDENSPLIEPSRPGHSTSPSKRPLTLLPLVALIFFDVSGGPFGTEDAVKAGGPLLAILGFIILPIVWSVPEALVTAELATAFPENSGYVAWVTAAFGPFWGFQEGYWSWVSGVTDNSVYPVMFAANLEIFFPVLKGGWPKLVFLVVLSLTLSYLNYRGLTVVGNTAVTVTLVILVPFILLACFCAPNIDVNNWLKVDLKHVDWTDFLNVMFWNLNYWDSVSTLAGEVSAPHKTFPRALMLAVVLVVAFYLFPTLAALGVMTDIQDWQLGYYGKVADQVGGKWLAIWIVIAAGASQVGQYQAEMSSDSYQLQGMADRGFLPKALSKRNRHDTPTLGIILSSMGVLCLASFDFTDIVQLLNAIYCLAELLEFAAFVWLRIKAPHLKRPYKIPLPTWALVVMLLPASALLMVLLLLPVVSCDVKMLAWSGAIIAFGLLLWPLLNMAKEREWCEFNELHFDFDCPLLDAEYLDPDHHHHLIGSRRNSLQTTPLSGSGGDLQQPFLLASQGSGNGCGDGLQAAVARLSPVNEEVLKRDGGGSCCSGGEDGEDGDGNVVSSGCCGGGGCGQKDGINGGGEMV